MKRRSFIQTLAVTPAAALPAFAEVPAVMPLEQQAPTQTEAAKLDTQPHDAVGEMAPRFFTAAQFAALSKLSDILLPPLNNMPGALDADAPEFLDFLISKSPAERQQLYRAGLDALNANAQRQFKKPFAELDTTQASNLLAPLREAWTYVPPTDPFARFLREAKSDVRTATTNSRAYATAGAAGRRGGGTGQYWFPLD
jgi:hypothetical protein